MKITVREFRNKLKYYLTLISTGEVVEVGDTKLTVYTENDTCVHAPSLEMCTPKPKLEELKAKIAHINAKYDAVYTPQEPVYTQEFPVCDKCHVNSEELKGLFEDGQEYLVCKSCRFKTGLKK